MSRASNRVGISRPLRRDLARPAARRWLPGGPARWLADGPFWWLAFDLVRPLVVGLFCVLAALACDRRQQTGSPDTVEVRAIEDCRDPCPEVSLTPVATLGDPDDPILPRLMTMVAAGDGYYAAGLLAQEGVVALYDQDGDLFRVVGRHGAGPGEFGLPFVFAGPGGTVWVVDIENQRITELGDGGQIRRFLSFTGAIHQVVPMDSGRAVLGGVLSGAFEPGDRGQPGAIRGPPYHIVRKRDTVEESTGERIEVGPEAPPVETSDLVIESSFGEWQRQGAVGPLPLAADPDDGHLFVAGGEEYALLEMTESGERLRRLERQPSWFPPGDNETPDPDTPWCCSMHVDTAGRIWTLVGRPVGAYRDAFDEQEQYSVASFDRVRDTVIEVIDPEAGQVVARARFPQSFMRFLPGSDLVYSVRQDSIGYVYFDLARPVIRP